MTDRIKGRRTRCAPAGRIDPSGRSFGVLAHGGDRLRNPLCRSVRGTAWDSLPEGRSIHDLDDGIERGIKLAGYLAILTGFVIAPRWATGRRWNGLELFVPRKAFLGTVAAAFLVSQLACRLEAGTSRSHGLTHNVSEFHELMLYCILCLYVLDLERERKTEQAEAVEATARRSVEREDSGRPGTSAVA